MFRKLSVFLILVISCLFFLNSVPVLAQCTDCEDGLKIKSEFRWRGEADGRDFNSDTDMAMYSSMRARLGFMYKMDNISTFLQFQVPRTLGWNSGVLATTGTFDIHQAYMDWWLRCCEGAIIRIGRQELVYGDERLIGAVDWSNVGRTFDGITVGYYQKDAFWFDLFMTKQAERSNAYPGPQGMQKDDLFLGLWGAYTPMKLNFFLLHNRDAGTSGGDYYTTLSRHTLGIHYMNNYDDMNLKVLFDFAYQMGTMEAVRGTPLDIGAYMVLLGAWYDMSEMSKLFTSVGAGIDMTSGDDDAADDKIAYFNNLYMTGHKWHGYMDYFTGLQMSGLRDIFVDLKWKCILAENAYWKFTFHNFATTAEYATAGGTSTALGNELDLTFNRKMNDVLSLDLGLGYFMPSEDWLGSNADNAMWGFLQLNAEFGDMKK